MSKALLPGFEKTVGVVGPAVLSPVEAAQLKQLSADFEGWLDQQEPWLAHGDFSTRHIFQQDGRYTGIIDFGDSRGMGRWYDLGYFHLRDGGLLPYRLLPSLLEGYTHIAGPSQDSDAHIRRSSIILGVPYIAAALRHGPLDPVAEHLVRRLREDLLELAS